MVYLITRRRTWNGPLEEVKLATDLFKAQEAASSMVYALWKNPFATKARQQQNKALLYDGQAPLIIGGRVKIEPLEQKA